MKLILVDDSLIELKLFEIECGQMPNFEIAGTFNEPKKALEYVEKHNDVVFALLDIDMPVMNGIELAEELRKVRSDIIIIFVTGHTEFAADAIRIKADFTVFKPFERADVLDALERAKWLSPRLQKRVYARTFGVFDLTIDDQTVHFRSAKAKELMALLVTYEGKNVSIHDIVDCLWEGNEDADTNNVGYRKAIKALADTLANYNASEIFERTRGFCRLKTDQVDSDYYQFLRGDREMRAAYQGVFLMEYAWAEPFVNRLLELKNQRN